MAPQTRQPSQRVPRIQLDALLHHYGTVANKISWTTGFGIIVRSLVNVGYYTRNLPGVGSLSTALDLEATVKKVLLHLQISGNYSNLKIGLYSIIAPESAFQDLDAGSGSTAFSHPGNYLVDDLIEQSLYPNGLPGPRDVALHSIEEILRITPCDIKGMSSFYEGTTGHPIYAKRWTLNLTRLFKEWQKKAVERPFTEIALNGETVLGNRIVIFVDRGSNASESYSDGWQCWVETYYSLGQQPGSLLRKIP